MDDAIAAFRLAVEVHEVCAALAGLTAAHGNLDAATDRAAVAAREFAGVMARNEAEALAGLEDDFYAGRGSLDSGPVAPC